VPFTSGVNFIDIARPPSIRLRIWSVVADVRVDVPFPPAPTERKKGAGDNRMETISIRKMKNGQSGSIAAVTISGELGRRIREMGLIPGTQITISGRAPLNDPVAVRIMDCTLTLRNNEADFILVHV
jgi:ferrous iron transport protein A